MAPALGKPENFVLPPTARAKGKGRHAGDQANTFSAARVNHIGASPNDRG